MNTLPSAEYMRMSIDRSGRGRLSANTTSSTSTSFITTTRNEAGRQASLLALSAVLSCAFLLIIRY